MAGNSGETFGIERMRFMITAQIEERIPRLTAISVCPMLPLTSSIKTLCLAARHQRLFEMAESASIPSSRFLQILIVTCSDSSKTAGAEAFSIRH